MPNEVTDEAPGLGRDILTCGWPSQGPDRHDVEHAEDVMAQEERFQIGEVAERTGLSIRTIRHYEEVGLVIPSTRSTGRFRLYSPADVARLTTVCRMKPLGFTLEQMRSLLLALDALQTGAPSTEESEDPREVIERFHAEAVTRVERAREELARTEDFADDLEATLRRE